MDFCFSRRGEKEDMSHWELNSSIDMNTGNKKKGYEWEYQFEILTNTVLSSGESITWWIKFIIICCQWRRYIYNYIEVCEGEWKESFNANTTG